MSIRQSETSDKPILTCLIIFYTGCSEKLFFFLKQCYQAVIKITDNSCQSFMSLVLLYYLLETQIRGKIFAKMESVTDKGNYV
jgi:hypothetical protein